MKTRRKLFTESPFYCFLTIKLNSNKNRTQNIGND